MEILLKIVLFPVKLVKKIGKGMKSFGKELNPIGRGFEWVCIKVYRFFRYAYMGFTAPFKLVAKGTSSLEEYERELNLQKQKTAEERRKRLEEEKERKKLETEIIRQYKDGDLVLKKEQYQQLEAIRDGVLKVPNSKDGYSELAQDIGMAVLQDSTAIGELAGRVASLQAANDDMITGLAQSIGLAVMRDQNAITETAENMLGSNANADLAGDFWMAGTDVGAPNNVPDGVTQDNLEVTGAQNGSGSAQTNEIEFADDFGGGTPTETQETDSEFTGTGNDALLDTLAQVYDAAIAGEIEIVPGEEEEKPEEKHVSSDEAIFFDEEEENKKKTIGDYINDFLEKIFKIPLDFYRGYKEKREAALLEKARKKGDINRQAMVLDFEGEDSEKEEKKVMWEYVCKAPDGKINKGYFAAYSKLEVHSFLTTQGMIVYSIRTSKWIQTMYSSVNGNGAKLKRKDLIFFLTQLSTYIKSGIPLVEAMNILTRQFKDKNYQRMFRSMMYDLTMGESFSKAMENQGTSFPPILINMVKSSELTGELPEALDDMTDYFTQVEAARKEMISALTYPTIVFVMAIGVTIFMLVYIVPQFTEIFTTMDNAEIPAFTKLVLQLSHFLQTKFIWLILGIVITLTIVIYLYRNVKVVRTGLQWLAMHIPIMGTIIIYNEVTMFSKTFSSLLSHNVFITDSMKVLKKITNNEIYKAMIFETVNNLAAGEKISAAFKDHWAFPIPAYEMIVTGEKTGQLAEMMAKVASYYQDEHKNAVTRVKSFMEPIIIVFLTVVVGGIVLSIIIPMFSMYDAVQKM